MLYSWWYSGGFVTTVCTTSILHNTNEAIEPSMQGKLAIRRHRWCVIRFPHSRNAGSISRCRLSLTCQLECKPLWIYTDGNSLFYEVPLMQAKSKCQYTRWDLIRNCPCVLQTLHFILAVCLFLLFIRLPQLCLDGNDSWANMSLCRQRRLVAQKPNFLCRLCLDKSTVALRFYLQHSQLENKVLSAFCWTILLSPLIGRKYIVGHALSQDGRVCPRYKHD